LASLTDILALSRVKYRNSPASPTTSTTSQPDDLQRAENIGFASYQVYHSSVHNSIRVGPAGWSYPDWKGRVYPRHRPPGFSEPGYLADFFDVIEINTSFYGAVPGTRAAKWVSQVAHNPRFQFTAKLHQNYTHRLSPADLTATDADDQGVREMADVLAGAGRLGALLVQFPWSFRNNTENRDYVGNLLEKFREYPMVVETRHASWNDKRYLDLLQEKNAAYCNIDQPVIGKSLEPSALATSNVGYVRLHGRNYKDWFAETGRNARYDYLYGTAELESWKDRIKQVAAKTASTYVITNNHFEGQAAANALELISILLDAPVRAPEQLVEAYPRLEACTVDEQGRLFERPKQ
jgi:uncharacterized protein YecE (DUF72 family)